MMKLKINRQREENTDVQEERKKEVKLINAAGMSVPKMMGLETGNVCICVCVCVNNRSDGWRDGEDNNVGESSGR